jgi:lipopolysaccharide export system protein LptA
MKGLSWVSRNFIASLAFLLALSSAAALAAGLDFTSQSSSNPIEIYSEKGIEWMQNEMQFIARGNARAARGNVVVRADTLIAHYRNKTEGSGTEIYKLDAVGNVRITSVDTTVYGETAVYDIDKTVLVVRGKPAKLTTPTDLVIAHDSLEYWETKRLAVARGDALVEREGKRLRADTITADLVEGKEGGGMQIKRADAIGNVLIKTPSEVAVGERGAYFVETGIATLTGQVKITRDQNQLNGGYAEVNMNTGVSKLFPAPPGVKVGGQGQRVQGLLVPDRSDKPKSGSPK